MARSYDHIEDLFKKLIPVDDEAQLTVYVKGEKVISFWPLLPIKTVSRIP